MKDRFVNVLQLFVITAALACSSALWAAPANATADSSGKQTTATTRKIDLNKATKAELETLPGIGPATANEIVAARPFHRVEDLKKVKGISDARFDQLRSHVTVSGQETTRPVAKSAPTAPSGTAQKQGEVTAPARAPASPTAKARIDLNTADAATLESLPGVGPATAQNIIAARPFKSVTDLQQVKGIGASKFEELRPLVTVRNNASASAVGTGPTAARGIGNEKTTQGTLSKGAEQKATGNTAGTKVNINTASLEELESLQGIGPVKAQAIIDNRPYKNIEDVMKVNGIKEGTYEQIKDRIRVR